jgi:hypothetical protein
MDFTVQTGQTKTESGTLLISQSFESPTGDRACILLQIKAKTQDAKTLEEECLSIIQHSLLGTEGDGWHRLDGTLKELNGLFKGFLISETVQDIHAILTLLDAADTLHVSHVGRGEAYLIRAGTASQITEFSRGKPVPSFIHISSGQLERGDIVVLSTQRLLRTLTPAQLSQLAQRGDQFLSELIVALDSEKELAALAVLHAEGQSPSAKNKRGQDEEPAMPASRRHSRQRAGLKLPSSLSFSVPQGLKTSLSALGKNGMSLIGTLPGRMGTLSEKFTEFLADLRHPERKRRAHLLLFAAAIVAFLLIFLVVRLSTSSQRSQTKAELQQLVTQITADIHTADNRRLAGDMEAANAILQRAEDQAKQVMDNESGLFRVEALDLLDNIRAKREEINNIVRVSPRVLVNVSGQNADVSAQGLIGISDGEMTVFDRQNAYGILLNNVYEPKKIADDDLIIDAAPFSRYKSQVFLTTGNSVIELSNNQLTTMKTEDPAGWVTGKDIETYLRYLYVLVPEKNKIEKYERLSNRYGTPVDYNVNGDLAGSLDMVIDGAVYVLKEGGTIVKLLRGESKTFSIRFLPQDALKSATKLYKVADGNFYFLDPAHARVIVATDGGTNGESSYVKQYILEGEQLSGLKDLYVDPDQTHLYVLDDKRVYIVDITAK